MSKNTHGVRIDATADMLLLDAAVVEIIELMSKFGPDGLTGVEALAVLAILRGANERLEAQQRQPAPVLKLIKPARAGHQERRMSDGR